MRRQNKKGISVLVAVLMMVAITIAAALLIYVYSSGLLGVLQGAQPQQPYSGQLVLEYYDWTTTTILTMTVRNVGSSIINLNRSDWLINGVKQPVSTITGCSAGSTGSSLLPGGTCPVTISAISGPTVVSGVAYTVKVATPSGSVFSYSCVAGRSTGSI
jgi:archaellum component FlaF (FlaF/FlaG flagellin family)